MSKLQYTLLASMLLALLHSCTSQGPSADQSFSLSGRLENGGDSLLILEELTTSEVLLIDTMQLSYDGSFSFSLPIEDAGFYMLRAGNNKAITLLVEPGEQIRLGGDYQRLPSDYRVEGSVGSSLLKELNDHLMYNFARVDTLVREYRARKYDEDFARLREVLDQRYADIFSDQQQYVTRFISDNPRSLASVIALYQYFGNKLLLRESTHFAYFERLSDELSEAYPMNKHVMDLKRRVFEYRRTREQRLLAEENLAPGKMAPEILLPDTSGNMISLSSLRGMYVLIDFWAAWCPPCRKTNQRLKSIYHEYKPLGFEIYAISLDRTREQWLRGIREDEIDWIQVSDLRYWNSPVTTLYNVDGIPHALLVDPEGRIVSRGLSTGELRQILEDKLGR